MNQSFILRNHNNNVDNFEANNAVRKISTGEVHYYLLAWGTIPTTDFIYKEISTGSQELNEDLILLNLGYERIVATLLF
jgi:hypothetical protein